MTLFLAYIFEITNLLHIYTTDFKEFWKYSKHKNLDVSFFGQGLHCTADRNIEDH
jgi:hypothetical protein